MTAQVIT